jgi:hypothetical protein
MAEITKTMMVVIMVSRRVGQVTLSVSARTSCKNLNGLTFAMTILLPALRAKTFSMHRRS